ncbi:MAG: S8 family serine peptidase, partial [Bdellovibrionales bacterium]
LKDNYWANPGETGLDAEGNDKATNGLDDDENGYVDDHRGWDFINGDNDPMRGHGHGTHCAGSIGAVGNNGIGVVGVNWKVSLVGLKIFSDAGRTTTEAITEAIEYSTLIGVDVTNNSWGGGSPSDTIKAAISEANDAQILFVAAAGNSSANNDTGSFYPANYELENIISVAAVDSLDRLASFSNYGKAKVHVAAPGVDILSTKPGGGYQNMSGTSMAAPHITGLVAFIKSQFPNDSMDRIRRRVVFTGDAVDALSTKLISGKRANAVYSLQDDNTAPAKIDGLEVVESLMSSVEINFNISGDDGFEGAASEYEVKVSNEPITDDNWAGAKLITSSDVSIEDGVATFFLENLDLNSTGYVAVRASDDIGNVSELSDSVGYSTLRVEILSENNADSLDGVEVTGTWGLEVSEDGSSVFSDSPDGQYGNKENSSLTLAPIEVTTEKSFLRLQTEYDLETKYDFGYVEVSVDSKTWVEVAKFNGKSTGVESPVINISDVVSGAESFQVRFRITSDSSQTRDGWKIDSMTVLGSLSL